MSLTRERMRSRSAPPGSSALRADSSASGAASKPMRPDHGASWMAKGAASGALLYLSDYATSDVYVYSWPGLKVVGTLTGFANPQGECVDKSGNVWVTNSSASQLLEYAHGGTSPIASLATPNQYPASCSVNLRTGELAVGSIESTTLGQGGVTLFKNASARGRSSSRRTSSTFTSLVTIRAGRCTSTVTMRITTSRSTRIGRQHLRR